MEGTAKNFRKRNAILTCLRETTTHPSAEWVYAQLKPEIPDLSLGTVYRNLALFKSQGLITSLGTVDGVERFDGNTQNHVHFVCTGCSGVTDVEGFSILPSLQEAAERDLGGQVTGCQITFTGLCPECTNQKQEEEAV